MARKSIPPAAPVTDIIEAAPPAPIETPAAPAPSDEQAPHDELAAPEAPPKPEPAVPEPPAPTEPPAVPPLDDYIAHHERAAQAVDLVVTAISHPDAKPRHHIGVYSGFPIAAGPLSATYNDGSTH